MKQYKRKYGISFREAEKEMPLSVMHLLGFEKRKKIEMKRKEERAAEVL